MIHATLSENEAQLHANLRSSRFSTGPLFVRYNRYRPHDCKLLIANPRGPVCEEQFQSKLSCNHKNRCQPISFDLAFLQSIGLSIWTLSVHLSLCFLSHFLALVIHVEIIETKITEICGVVQICNILQTSLLVNVLRVHILSIPLL